MILGKIQYVPATDDVSTQKCANTAHIVRADARLRQPPDVLAAVETCVIAKVLKTLKFRKFPVQGVLRSGGTAPACYREMRLAGLAYASTRLSTWHLYLERRDHTTQ